MTIVFLIFLSLLSGLLYRLGGWGQEGRDKFPKLPEWVFDTKARDIGCAAVAFIAMKYVFHIVAPWWIHLIAFLLTFGALTTYWDEAPWNKGKDNFYNHGTACISLFPIHVLCRARRPARTRHSLRSTYRSLVLDYWA